MKLPLLTVFTDASYDADTGAAGWAAWAKRSDMRTFFHAGGFKGSVLSSLHAEMGAVANACHMLMNNGYLGGDHHVLIKTDCEAVIHHLGRFPRMPKESSYRDYAEVIVHAKDSVRCLEIRHVKGHLPNSAGRRHAVNNRCDVAARAAMRKVKEKRYGR